MDFESLLEEVYETFPNGITNEDVVYLCIGTDRSTGDSLAPMVGSILTDLGYTNVYGTLDDPVHAMNLMDTLMILPSDKLVIAIDACLGRVTSIGNIRVFKGSIKAGAGVKKDLPAAGDYSITGIVNVGGYMEYEVLRNTRLSLVKNMADSIVDLILHRFQLESEADKNILIT
ncbi:spore protease YyaC [Paenibacillus ferrarius]|uniref:Spore protease YyaC n=1 Tax=Paenibacillus ferrarius TaxID=1469647 RepID=A0A1V4HTM5_9BACL|nr:spore protease YyaC [Paenibacillus ferrarius]OPH61863.1 spore protease YyaC [Paenibacillus ferrarius]